ncbi:hypothetical protein OCAR_6614 [Afipia carboxidovorans OM5]|nr:hypothetical protein OCAR_6614 [Afipia carboxidovorans OM5]
MQALTNSARAWPDCVPPPEIISAGYYAPALVLSFLDP